MQLPVTTSSEIDFAFMESFIAEQEVVVLYADRKVEGGTKSGTKNIESCTIWISNLK